MEIQRRVLRGVLVENITGMCITVSTYGGGCHTLIGIVTPAGGDIFQSQLSFSLKC